VIKREFILQGFTARTHADAVRELFDIPDVERVLLSVAFVSERGVEQIEAELKAHAAYVTILVGIRNDITSYQGLVRLHSIGGELYTVDTGSRMIVFHPKIYLVRGKSFARLVVGSANLTLGGLHNNIEVGMFLEFDMTNSADMTFINEIEAQFALLPTEYPNNIVKVDAISVLDEMLASGRIVDEMAIPPPRPSTSAGENGVSDTVARIKLKVNPLHRTPTKVTSKKEPIVPKILETTKADLLSPVSATVGLEFELVWESKPLERRDLLIPKAARTHQAAMSLDKGLLSEDIDHRHFFREEVFSYLTWSKNTLTTDVAYAKFHLIIKGISYGEYDLAIRHTTSITSKTYMQRNAMTRLSWGPIRRHIAREDLLGRTLALYRDKVDPTRFILEID